MSNVSLDPPTLPDGFPFPHPGSHIHLPPLGEAEWRGGVGVGGGWARREGDEEGAAGWARAAIDSRVIDEAPRGSAPYPARALPESASPPLASRAGEGGARRRPSCVN